MLSGIERFMRQSSPNGGLSTLSYYMSKLSGTLVLSQVIAVQNFVEWQFRGNMLYVDVVALILMEISSCRPFLDLQLSISELVVWPNL